MMSANRVVHVFRSLAVAFLFESLLAANPAHAESSDVQRAAAQDLFDQAQTLMTQARYAEACPKFEASHQLVGGIGTRFNLADCYEKVGKIASAWASFRSVADASRARGDVAREEIAEQRARDLLPRLSYVTVTVQEPTKGITVKRDNTEVPKGAWGTPLPIDAGTHRIEAIAPGKQPWNASLTVDKVGSTLSITVPKLQDIDAPPITKSPARIPHAETQSGSSQKTWAIISGAVGVAGLGLGTSMVLLAEHTYSNADCGDANVCSRSGQRDRSAAIHTANWSMLPLGVGLAGVGAGLTLWFTKSRASSGQATARLMFYPNRIGLLGRF